MSDDRAAGVPVTGVSELVLEVVDLDAAEEFYAGVLAAILPARRAARLDVLEALAYE